MKRVVYYVLKVVSITLLIVPVILCLPGLILHILSEEMETKTVE